MSFRALLGGLLIILSSVFSGCSSGPQEPSLFDSWVQSERPLKVLCTTGMIEDLVNYVGGKSVASITLITGQLDPHTYELVKGDDEKLAYADLIFSNGLQLEHGPSLRHYLEDNDRVISLGDLLQEKHPKLILYISGQPDPHIWTDVSMWRLTVDSIVEALSQALPEKAESFAKRGARLKRELAELHEGLLDQLHCVKPEKRFLVTSHDAFNYFARAYLREADEGMDNGWQKRCEAPEGLAPESQLSPVDIQRLIDHMTKYRIRVIFPESNVSQDSIRKIQDAAREKGFEITIAEGVLYADAMGEPGSSGDSYMKMMSHNAALIAEYLDGQCQ